MRITAMKRLIFSLLIVIATTSVWSQASMAPADLYAVLSEEDAQPVVDALADFPEPSNVSEKAYKGVLLMKSASAKEGVAEKLETFKAGHELLEGAILEEPTNTEFRFLRLIIQENAPKILGYHKDVKEDKAQIVGSYSQLSKALKDAILNYANHSKILLKEDFE